MVMFFSTKMFSVRRINRGFTLLELLIVVVIIGILASVGVPRYNKVVKKAKVAEADAVLGAMRGSEMRYYAENGVYTVTETSLDIDVPGYGGYAASKYFTFTAASTGTVTATGKATGGMSGVTVTLTITGGRSVSGI